MRAKSIQEQAGFSANRQGPNSLRVLMRINLLRNAWKAPWIPFRITLEGIIEQIKQQILTTIEQGPKGEYEGIQARS